MQTRIAYFPPAPIANGALARVGNLLAAMPKATPLARAMGASRLAARLYCAMHGHAIGTPAAHALASMAVQRYLVTGQTARPVRKHNA